jgi:HAD superfamily hydrolase (TIGR01509 family)
MGENRYIGGVAEKYGLKVDIDEVKARTYTIYETLVQGKLRALPGAIQFIKSCRSSGFRLALATSTDKVKMEINLREIGLSRSDFDAVINGLEVERKKPFPDIYLMAAERIGLTPSECLVAEDAVSGVRAAKAAGCKCLALLTSFTAQELEEADWICSTLAEVPPEALLW